MATWKEELGVFNVKGDKIRATDPCYDKSCDGGVIIDNCMPGIWRAVAEMTDETEGWGLRISYLMVARENFESFHTKKEVVEQSVAVDSGQAGFFCENSYPEGKSENNPVFDIFYDQCCTATLGKRQADTVNKIGAVSTSGYGDGIYDLTLWKDDVGKVLAARIDFLNKEEEDPYKEDCYFI